MSFISKTYIKKIMERENKDYNVKNSNFSTAIKPCCIALMGHSAEFKFSGSWTLRLQSCLPNAK